MTSQDRSAAQGRREWPLWAVMLVRWPLMGPLAAVMFAGQLADLAFDWLDRSLPGAAPYRPRKVPYE